MKLSIMINKRREEQESLSNDKQMKQKHERLIMLRLTKKKLTSLKAQSKT
jgi:hypothetical protein